MSPSPDTDGLENSHDLSMQLFSSVIISQWWLSLNKWSNAHRVGKVTVGVSALLKLWASQAVRRRCYGEIMYVKGFNLPRERRYSCDSAWYRTTGLVWVLFHVWMCESQNVLGSILELLDCSFEEFWGTWTLQLKLFQLSSFLPSAEASKTTGTDNLRELTHSYDYQDSGTRFAPHLPKCWTTP